MSSRLNKKVAIVTGGGSGYGAGIATKFASEGAKVIVADISIENGEKTAKELGCIFVKADVTCRQDWETLLQTAVDKYGGVDIVVNNAGASYQNKPTIEVQESDFDLCMNINAKSIFLSTSVIIRQMLKQKRGGSFIQIASTAAKRPRPGLTWYSASKAAATMATKSMAVEFAPEGIRFNAVNPVVGGTGMTHLFMGKPDTPENRAEWIATIPMGRFCQPKDVGNTCCFLASDEADFLTGLEIEVDGGRCV